MTPRSEATRAPQGAEPRNRSPKEAAAQIAEPKPEGSGGANCGTKRKGGFAACVTLACRRMGVLGASERAERGADLRRGRKGAFANATAVPTNEKRARHRHRSGVCRERALMPSIAVAMREA